MLDPYPYLSTLYPYGEGYGFIVEMHRYIHKPTVLQTPLQNRRFILQRLLRAMGAGDRRRVTGDGVVVVGMVVGRAGRGAATWPCHGCGVFPPSPSPLVLVLWAIGNGRRATGDGR